jgi:hypothetical protein
MRPEELQTGPDGVPRARAEQARINELLALAFKGDAGKAAMDYLRSISIERVCGPGASDAELRHLEGMRFIVAVISQRIAAAHREKTNEPGKPADPAFLTPGRRTRKPGRLPAAF